MDRQTAQRRIDEIDVILARGASSVTHNGRTITYDLAAMRRERDRLQAWLNRGSGGKNLRTGRYNSGFTR